MRLAKVSRLPFADWLWASKQGEAFKDHRREAARLRWLAASATTAAMKARLLDQARHHDWLASIEPDGYPPAQEHIDTRTATS